jgi:hypothetical protein
MSQRPLPLGKRGVRSGKPIGQGLQRVDGVEKQIGLVLILTEVGDFPDLPILKAKNETPLEVESRRDLAVAAMVVDYVVAAFRNYERLRLEICTRKLIEKRHYLGYAMLGACQRVMTRDSPYDVISHHSFHGANVLLRVGGKERLDLVKMAHEFSLQHGCASTLRLTTLA